MFRDRRIPTLAAVLVAFTALAAAAPLCAADTTTPLAQKPEVAAAIEVFDAWVDWTARNREQPAVSIGIVYDQDLIWAKGYGYADLAKKIPATPATAYRIASISKTFTAHALLQLRDAGKLQLDDPITRWISELKLSKVDPQSPPITIRHLLTHTSGIPREVDGTYWNDMNFPSREAMLPVLARMGVVWAPEKEWKYSNVAVALAGYVVEAASGEPYAEYVARHILAPLGMSATRVIPPRDMPTLAVGYGRRVPGTPRRVEPFFNGAYMIPASNLASTVEDLAKYVELQFRTGAAGGAQILKGSTLAEMQRVQWLQPDWKSGWGLGWGISRRDDQTRLGHGGSVPGHRTQVSFVPGEKFAVIVLTNAEDGRPSLYVNQAYAIVAPAIAKVRAKPPAENKGQPAWQKYVGVYAWEDDEVHVAVLDGKLSMFDPAEDNPWASKVTLEPVSGNVFRQVGGDAAGETVTF
ncbi:MAG: serine hydrolase domain-containing protein, partial [Thermoanaerobaculia bacterium]